MKYHIAYDIVSDKRRKKISDILSEYGIRIQFSIFRADLSKKQLKEILSKCNNIINTKTDSILFIPFCKDCESGLKVSGQETHTSIQNFIDL